VAERRTADAEQAGDTSGQTPLPLWVTIGDQDLADSNPDSAEGELIGEYQSDSALQSAVGRHQLETYMLAAIEEVRGGAAKTSSATRDTPLPLWVTIGDQELADSNPDSAEGELIGEYQSDRALQTAVDAHPLQDYILAAIDEVRGGEAPSSEINSPQEGGAQDA
jgi:hypothetical protein